MHVGVRAGKLISQMRERYIYIHKQIDITKRDKKCTRSRVIRGNATTEKGDHLSLSFCLFFFHVLLIAM